MNKPIDSERYIIGSGPAPPWCSRYLMQFRKVDGTTGYEFHARHAILILSAGDVLVRRRNTFEVEEMKYSEKITKNSRNRDIISV